MFIPVSDVDRCEGVLRAPWLEARRRRHPRRRLAPDPVHAPGIRAARSSSAPSLTSAAPGSAQSLYLVVSDVEAARRELVAAGPRSARCSTKAASVLASIPPAERRLSGPAPEHSSYGSFATFSDPDGNGWLLQEVTTRLPGRVDPGTTSSRSASRPGRRLASGVGRPRQAREAHRARADRNWPDWYADYMVSEQTGEELPS